MRLVLRLWRPDRFEAAASDRLGRTLWEIEVDAARHRARLVADDAGCRFDPRRSLALPGVVVPLPLTVLPGVLLGRLPVAAEASAAAGVDRGGLVDSQGARWWWGGSGGVLEWWRLEPRAGAAIEWRRSGSSAVLSLAGEELELEWRQSASETLIARPPAWRQRDEPECEHADLP